MDEPTAAEQADIELKKAQTDDALRAGGAIDGTDIRERLINDLDSGLQRHRPGRAGRTGRPGLRSRSKLAEQSSESEIESRTRTKRRSNAEGPQDSPGRTTPARASSRASRSTPPPPSSSATTPRCAS